MDVTEGKMDSKRRRSHSPVEHKDGHTKERESFGRKDNSRYLENDPSHARSSRGHDFVRHSDRQSCGASRESKRRDDYRRYRDKHADDNDRSHHSTFRSDQESRAGTYYDRSKHDSSSDRSRGDWRNVDSQYGDKSAKREQRSKHHEKQESPRGEYDKYADSRKQTYSTRRYPEEMESKNKDIVKQEEALKKRNCMEVEKNSYITEPEVEIREKRRSLFSSVGPDVENSQHMEKSDTSWKKPLLDCSGDSKCSAPNEVKEEGPINSVDAAKIAAMKAAELVNKNIVGFGVGTGRLSTDQKKKLLWGNKKSNPAETSTHWDSNLFSDRERQEKFNKLMNLRMPWWLWPIVGCEEQLLRVGSREQGQQQGGRLNGSQETGGARHRPGEALRGWPAPERWSNCWSWPVGNPTCKWCSIEELKCLPCKQFICLLILACGNLTGSFASPVEVVYYHLVASEQLYLHDTCIVTYEDLH